MLAGAQSIRCPVASSQDRDTCRWRLSRRPRNDKGVTLRLESQLRDPARNVSFRRRASRPVGRVLCTRSRGPAAIHLGLPLLTASCGLPASIGRAALKHSRRPRGRNRTALLDLAPGGVCQAARVTPGAGGLLHLQHSGHDLHRRNQLPHLLRPLSADGPRRHSADLYQRPRCAYSFGVHCCRRPAGISDCRLGAVSRLLAEPPHLPPNSKWRPDAPGGPHNPVERVSH
jgi:hypothetical protein